VVATAALCSEAIAVTEIVSMLECPPVEAAAVTGSCEAASSTDEDYDGEQTVTSGFARMNLNPAHRGTQIKLNRVSLSTPPFFHFPTCFVCVW
jgi:hypothetical protein